MASPKYPCPCCGHVVFGEPPGSFEICPICSWEDDIVQLFDPTFRGGPNQPSLIEAQLNYLSMGVSDERFVEKARRPSPQDRRDAGWRPFDAAKDRMPESARAHARHEDATRAYWWRRAT